jgi:hypothetical protein
MFGKPAQDSAAAPSFFYLMMAASYYRQATRTRHPHLRHALRDSGREYLTSARRVVPVHACAQLRATPGALPC